MLTAHQLKILDMLGKGMYQAKVAKQMEISRQAVSSISVKLQNKGYLEVLDRSCSKTR